MGVEYEWKFRADPDVLDAIDHATVGSCTIYQMQTTYYDTPDNTLSQRFYTLRCRMENDVAVCTLKAPREGAGRSEWEVRCGDIHQAIPELCKLGAPEDLQSLTAGELIPVCGARFTRRAKTVQLDTCTVELALDRGVLIGGGKELPLCEVEVELKSGTPERCDAYARQLAVAFALQPEKGSKFSRALALYKGAL